VLAGIAVHDADLGDAGFHLAGHGLEIPHEGKFVLHRNVARVLADGEGVCRGPFAPGDTGHPFRAVTPVPGELPRQIDEMTFIEGIRRSIVALPGCDDPEAHPRVLALLELLHPA